MPFGLANVPEVFQRALMKGLDNLKNTIALVYLDAILIPSETFEEGIQSLKLVLEALQKARFSLHASKCTYLRSSVIYLGRQISAQRKFRLCCIHPYLKLLNKFDNL